MCCWVAAPPRAAGSAPPPPGRPRPPGAPPPAQDVSVLSRTHMQAHSRCQCMSAVPSWRTDNQPHCRVRSIIRQLYIAKWRPKPPPLNSKTALALCLLLNVGLRAFTLKRAALPTMLVNVHAVCSTRTASAPGASQMWEVGCEFHPPQETQSIARYMPELSMCNQRMPD